MSKMIFALALVVALLSGAQWVADGDGSRNQSSTLIYYGETPPGSQLAFSVLNVGPDKDAGVPCDIVRAILRIAGTLASRTETDGVKALELLHEERFVLAPGEVRPFLFLQSSRSTETVILQTATSARNAPCLEHSGVTILDAAGNLVTVVPAPVANPRGGVRYIDDAL